MSHYRNARVREMMVSFRKPLKLLPFGGVEAHQVPQANRLALAIDAM